MKFLLILHLITPDGVTSRGWAVFAEQDKCHLIGTVVEKQFTSIDRRGNIWKYTCEEVL